MNAEIQEHPNQEERRRLSNATSSGSCEREVQVREEQPDEEEIDLEEIDEEELEEILKAFHKAFQPILGS